MKVPQNRHFIAVPIKGIVEKIIVVAGFFGGIRKSRTPYSLILLGLPSGCYYIKNQSHNRHQKNDIPIEYLCEACAANASDLLKLRT
jgi:hypothetical protein